MEINVSKNPYEAFLFQVLYMAETFNVRTDPEINRAIEILEGAINSKIARKLSAKKAKSIEEYDETKKFISIFKHKYLSVIEMEYYHQFKDREIKMIDELIKKFKIHDVSSEEYLEWLFGEFHQKSPETELNIFLTCSNNIFNKFLFIHREELKKRQNKKKRQTLLEKIMSDARALYRETKNEEIIKILEKAQKGKLSLGELKEAIEKFK